MMPTGGGPEGVRMSVAAPQLGGSFQQQQFFAAPVQSFQRQRSLSGGGPQLMGAAAWPSQQIPQGYAQQVRTVEKTVMQTQMQQVPRTIMEQQVQRVPTSISQKVRRDPAIGPTLLV